MIDEFSNPPCCTVSFFGDWVRPGESDILVATPTPDSNAAVNPAGHFSSLQLIEVVQGIVKGVERFVLPHVPDAHPYKQLRIAAYVARQGIVARGIAPIGPVRNVADTGRLLFDGGPLLRLGVAMLAKASLMAGGALFAHDGIEFRHAACSGVVCLTIYFVSRLEHVTGAADRLSGALLNPQTWHSRRTDISPRGLPQAGQLAQRF